MKHHFFHRHDSEAFGWCAMAGRGRRERLGFLYRHAMGGKHGHHHHHHGMGRLLAHGDLRTVVLLLVEEQPRHGYELIKLVEEKSSGQYSPSPGVIYPTLTYLEEMGFVKTKEQEGKKQYSLTPEGKVYLEENRTEAKAILERLEEIGKERAKADTAKDPFGRGNHGEMRHAFFALGQAIRQGPRTGEHKKRILEILEKARKEIESLAGEEK